jgi:hypothetical protein
MTQADRMHSMPRITASKTNPPDQAPMTPDDEIGMAWWNALTKQERAKWSAIAGNTGRAKDAWEAFRRGSMDQSPPVDPTRRRFLAVAAVASVVSAGTLAAATQAANVPQAVSVPQGADPIFEVIEAHRKAAAASAAASAECRRLHDLADEIVGHSIEIPSMIEPGTIVQASMWLDIEQAIPSAIYPNEYAHQLALLDQHQKARFAIHGNTDPIGEEEYEAEWDLVGEFADTVPTTLAGLLAMVIYADEMLEKENDVFGEFHPNLIATLATAARTIGRQA